MNSVLEKVKGFLSNIPTLKYTGLCMLLVQGYLIVLGTACILYLVAWLYQWIVLGQLKLVELKDIIVVFSSPSFVAAVGGLALLLIDKDGDNLPDKLELELKENEERITNNKNRIRDNKERMANNEDRMNKAN